jgi:prophage regulatory protein
MKNEMILDDRSALGCRTTRILRMPQVIDRVGMSKSSIYDYISKGTFPSQIKLGARSSGWLESDIDCWIAQRLHADTLKCGVCQ